MGRIRRYTWTLHDPTPEDEAALKGLNVKYICYGRETCPKTGRPHLQGYLELKNAKTWTATKAFIGIERLHLLVSCGTAKQNRTYCVKDNDFYEAGDISKQGERNDLENIKAQIMGGMNVRTIIGECSSLQQIRVAEKLATYFEKPRDFKPTIKWYYGSTGTGKTRAAFEECEDPYVATGSIKWWDGYDGHPEVIIDDFRKDWCKFHELLKLLDRYEFRIEYKGGYRQMLAKTIIITCPYSPEDVYDTREDVGQLLRRIDEIKCFDKYNADNSQHEEASSPLPSSSWQDDLIQVSTPGAKRSTRITGTPRNERTYHPLDYFSKHHS
jgi:hypothetical protein